MNLWHYCLTRERAEKLQPAKDVASRSVMLAPFVVGDWCYATDGVIAVRTPVKRSRRKSDAPAIPTLTTHPVVEVFGLVPSDTTWKALSPLLSNMLSEDPAIRLVSLDGPNFSRDQFVRVLALPQPLRFLTFTVRDFWAAAFRTMGSRTPYECVLAATCEVVKS